MSITSFRLEDIKERAALADAAVESEASTNRMLIRLAKSQADISALVAAIEAAFEVLGECLDDWEQRDKTHRIATEAITAIGYALGGEK